MSEATLASGARRKRRVGLARGASLGRYVVLEHLGAGGMGAVYAAFDPQLDRRVALKVLHAELDERNASGTPRLLREAQAMARLTHPNVVTVHDVGLENDQLFVAMELVDGVTLQQWCGDPSRTVAQRLSVCLAAGRGLAAAHARGLVHRDFKPDNVMVAADGRVLVMDFGLARPSDGGGLPAGGGPSAPGSIAGSSELTQTGAVLGTPAYMSPEQFAGDIADARSDQFAFCVTAWEAVYSERPFAGDSLASLAAAVRAAELRTPSDGRRVPSAVHVALSRGLSADPERRFDTMDALLTALSQSERGPRARVLAGVGLVVLGGGAALATTGPDQSPAGDPCPSASPQVAEHWGPARASELARAFEATDVRYASSAWARVREQLDAFFVAWGQTHLAVCRATHVAHEQSETRLDLRMDCLADGLRHADATIEELMLVDGEMVPRASDMVAGLPPPAQCATTTLATDTQAWSDSDARRVAETRSLYAGAKARLDAGRTEAALATVADGLERLAEVNAPRLQADLLAAQAQAEHTLGRLDAAEQTLRRALGVATTASLADKEAELWMTLIHVVGELQQRPKEATAYQLPARLATERADLPRLDIRLALVAGEIAVGEGRPREAIEHYHVALSQDPDDHVEAVTRNNLGNALFEVHRYAEALEQMQRVYAADLERYGAEHPTLALDLMNLGRIHNALGATEDARNEYQRALALNERLLGPVHAAVGNCLLNLGGLEKDAGALDTAREHYERALAIYEEVLRPEHPYVSFVLTNLGTLTTRQGRLEEALELQRRALTIVDKNYEESHPQALTIRANLANALSDVGRHDEAAVAFEEVIRLREAAHGADDLSLAYPLLGLAQVLIEVNRASESVAFARRALALRLAGGAEPTLVATARFVVAIVELAVGNRQVAFQEARQAANTVAPDGPAPAPLHQQIVDWLAEHGG